MSALTPAGGLFATVLADLDAESADLDDRVADLPDEDWRRATPAAGWTVADTIAHLEASDQMALTAVTSQEAFRELFVKLATEGMGVVDAQVSSVRDRSKAETMRVWREGRADLSSAIAAVEPGTKIGWFGPPMSPVSFATARLMETWAHGQDVVDALGQVREPTARLKHVAEIGVRTHVFAHVLRDEAMPGPVRVELAAPDGSTWAWGPADAEQRVSGPALDFCLLVTQRRHRSDLALTAVGAEADHWLDIAQAFAGAPSSGRAPLA